MGPAGLVPSVSAGAVGAQDVVRFLAALLVEADGLQVGVQASDDAARVSTAVFEKVGKKSFECWVRTIGWRCMKYDTLDKELAEPNPVDVTRKRDDWSKLDSKYDERGSTRAVCLYC